MVCFEAYGSPMLRVGRRSTVAEHLSPSGVPVRLVGEIWSLAVAQRWGGGGFSYHRPRYVDTGDARVTIVDFVGLARVLGLTLLGVVLLRRIAS
jgi:hypothetical protein